MKQREYTEKQKEIIEILKPLKELTKYSSISGAELRNFIKETEIKYEIKPLYKTLRQYLFDNSKGAYHHFVFKIGKIEFDVIGVEEFEIYYNKELLDFYFVTNDEEKDNDGDCETYRCYHYLTIERKE